MQSRSRATVDAVLSAAAHILESQGLGALNTNAVAERAGVSIGSLYQYFPGKDAILVALIEREHAIFGEELARAADAARGGTIGEALESLLRFGLSHHMKRRTLSHILEVEHQRLQASVDCSGRRDQSLAAMARLLGRHRRAIHVDELDVAAEEIGVIARALMRHAGQRGATDWDAVIERTVGAMLGYLGVEPRRMKEAAE